MVWRQTIESILQPKSGDARICRVWRGGGTAHLEGRARFGSEWAAEPRYASYSAGVREIVRREGAMALFAGLRPTLLGIMPYSALSFAAFETLKAHLKQKE